MASFFRLSVISDVLSPWDDDVGSDANVICGAAFNGTSGNARGGRRLSMSPYRGKTLFLNLWPWFDLDPWFIFIQGQSTVSCQVTRCFWSLTCIAWTICCHAVSMTTTVAVSSRRSPVWRAFPLPWAWPYFLWSDWRARVRSPRIRNLLFLDGRKRWDICRWATHSTRNLKIIISEKRVIRGSQRRKSKAACTLNESSRDRRMWTVKLVTHGPTTVHRANFLAYLHCRHQTSRVRMWQVFPANSTHWT